MNTPKDDAPCTYCSRAFDERVGGIWLCHRRTDLIIEQCRAPIHSKCPYYQPVPPPPAPAIQRWRNWGLTHPKSSDDSEVITQ